MGMKFQTAATMACMKSLLMVFNLAFWTSGLAILCAGIWMQVELNKFLELNTDYSTSTPFILVATGGLILLVSTLACCCTVKGQPSLLFLYGGFLGIILILELALAGSIYAYKDRLKDGFDVGLAKSMEGYGSVSNSKTIDFDYMQSKLHCCGSEDYRDWGNLDPPSPVPRSCCIKPNCDVQDETQIYTEGCYTKVVQLITKNMKVIGGVAVALTLFPLAGSILACCLAANLTKAKYEQMS